MEKAIMIIRLNLQPISITNIHTSFKYLQIWGLHRFPGQPIPTLAHPLREEVPPNLNLWCNLRLYYTLAKCYFHLMWLLGFSSSGHWKSYFLERKPLLEELFWNRWMGWMKKYKDKLTSCLGGCTNFQEFRFDEPK